MIKNQWYAVMNAREVGRGKPVGATRFSEKLVFWRDETGRVCCIRDRCCHRGASLSAGCVREGRVECPFHGFQYDASGKTVLIPANGKNAPVPENFRVLSYPVREACGFLWVWYGAARPDLPELPFFPELEKGFSWGEISETWNVHYTRAIENQLDVVHLPFVHRSTIGRGNKTLVNGPVVKWDGTLMTFYVKNEEDRGQTPQKPGEIPEYGSLFSLKLRMPNLWQNVVSPRLRIVAAFAPVDEEHTKIYLRFYQNFLRLPVLREAVNGMGCLMDRVVLHQDRRVVLTQQPRRSELFMGENLVQGDLPIIEYRKKRQELREKKG